MPMGRLATSAAWMLSLWLFSACGGSPPGDDKGELAVSKQLVEGRVYDADTRRVLEGVEIKTSSGAQVKTDPQGRFAVMAEAGTTQVDLAKSDYASTVKEAASDAHVEVFIKVVDTKVEFEAQRGTTVQLESGSSVDIPPGAVIDREGKLAEGMVQLQVASVSGRKREQSAALPKNDGISQQGSKGKVAIGYAVDIKLTDAAGQPLSVRAGANVVAELPVLTSDAPEKQSGFSFDEKQGAWVQEGDVTRVVDDKGRRVYRKQIDHLSWHGYGQLFTQLGCLRACALDVEGKPLTGAQIWIMGSSYSGSSSLFTGSDGCATGEVPPAQEIVLLAQGNGRTSAPLRHVTAAAPTDATTCEAVTPLMVTQEHTGECPLGFESCGGECVDTATDDAHCGNCDNACAGGAGAAQRCVAGACACPSGQTRCGNDCVNIAADPDHCGACNTPCTGGDACVATQCSPAVACQAGFTRCGRDCVDLAHNETRCGSCDVSCQPDELCLNVCVSPAATPALCSNDASVRCEDDLFCNGNAACNPASNQALANGCVLAVAPCAAGLCDEAQNQCTSAPAGGTNDAGVSCSALESPVALQNAPVDVIIAVDTSGSMAPYFCNVAASLSAFMDGLRAEMRLVTLYDMGALAATSTTICGAADPLANSTIAQDPARYRHLMVTVDSFNGFSQLVTEHQNYGSFLRPNAATHFVMVTDDDNGTPAADFKTQMEALLGHSFVFHALVADGQNGCVGAQVGTQYLALADLTGGKKLPICSAMPSTTGNELTASVQASSSTSCRVTDVSTSPELVQLFLRPSSGTQTQLPRANDAQGCATTLAWYYEGSTVTLCPATCPLARQGGQLVLGTGCAPLTL